MFDNFKPDSIVDKIGSTTPSLPYVPPPSEAGCNVVAMVLIVAITVVASLATAGALSGLAYSTFGELLLAGGTALTGGVAGATGIAAAAAGGFVGSLAGQAAGNLLGVQDGFDFGSALVSGFTAGITAGVGSYLGVGGTEASTFTEIAKEGSKATLTTGGKAILAATSAVTSAAANKLVGNPSGFSWANVAASIGTAAIASELNLDGGPLFDGAIKDGSFPSDLIGGFARAGISYGIKKGFFNKGSWNFENVATDVFGNAIGNSIVRGQTLDSKTLKDLAEFDARTTHDASVSVNQRINQNLQNAATERTITRRANEAVNLNLDVSTDALIANLSGGDGNGGSGGSEGGSFTSFAESAFGGYVANRSVGYSQALTRQFDNLLSAQANFRAEVRGQVDAFGAIQKARFERGDAAARLDTNNFNARSQGFKVDLNDDATRLSFAYGVGAQTQAELNAAALGVVAGAVSLPLLVGDLVALGSLTASGLSSLGRGLLSAGQSIRTSFTNIGQNVAANGVRGSLLNVSRPVNFLEVQLAHRGAQNTILNSASFTTQGFSKTLTSTLSRAGNMLAPVARLSGDALANPNVQAGLLNGSTSAWVDYSIKGDVGSASRAFGAGFIGGAIGNSVGSFASPVLQPVVGGIYGGVASEIISQRINGDDFNISKVLLAGAIGGAATFGANKMLGVYAPKGLIVTPQSTTFRPLAASTVAGISGGILHSEFSNIFKF
ncbi:hypothetical protein KIH87_12715 [Paraneptunicella aestuarii]|uniref:hypothetical protein n=1 Tax=Paraneptunicella aestuarii TaxID=2831148 RepID=UPI001E5A06E5|nr:hypothetical protein [Paraneptunicella aestuarii]UAA37571.1 hypothetical protein KIH87_12715 [Paraneptunicella aestuarii]